MVSRWTPRVAIIAGALIAGILLSGQVIEYEANGMKYQTLSRKGLTVIITHMPNHVAGFGLIQISISNGSDMYWMVQPEDFAYIKNDTPMTAISAGQIVE